MNDDEIQEVIQSARDRAIEDFNNLPWYQQNLDISVPLMIIAIGFFQYVLRKWVLPVSRDTIEELEDQLPSQGLIFYPGFGIILMIFGFILLFIFNIDHIF